MASFRDRWTVLGERVLLARPPYVTVTQQQVRTSAGATIDDFYRVDLASFAVCVPQLADGGIMTLWQYKHGPQAYGLSFPAGYLEPGEEPLAACQRELLEETGLAGGDWSHLGSFVDNGNQRGSLGHFYLATGCHFAGEPDHGDLEEMELRVMRPNEIDAALAAGQIQILHHAAAWSLARGALLG
ncbi:NUDIX domain-containing protein [Alteraurantiacibacter buctensis]|uniref:NUDIX domain-containing protein n=1 Tax=Alteraurantiacibacter buctensis TaxID=1503981 RepID=A0A844Z156_9SPHN|nr:NUDIX domain-containing protein [Alteraurantiacibacter buctensis]